MCDLPVHINKGTDDGEVLGLHRLGITRNKGRKVEARHPRNYLFPCKVSSPAQRKKLAERKVAAAQWTYPPPPKERRRLG